jgi:endonuclease/exonuclease/phosphatase family metal-dependent hydrolase
MTADSHRLRLLSWNLDHHPEAQLERTRFAADTIRALQPDVVCVQETTGERLELLSEFTGLAVASRSGRSEAVLSNHRVEQRFEIPFAPGARAGATGAVLDTGCHRYAVVSAHLTWGSGTEHLRLEQAITLDDTVDRYASLEPFRDGGNGVIGVLAGDLNAEPGAASIRYLTGLGVENGRSTTWTDAWVRGSGDGVSSSASNPLAVRTARVVGLDGEGVVPERRIDYIMVRGYAYRRPGAPLATRLIGVGDAERTASDHYGIFTELSC